MLPSAYNGSALTNFTPLTVTGVLNGTLSGDSKSNVIATINPIPSDTFKLGDATSTLAGLPNQLLLVPASAGGTTTLEAAIATAGTANPQAPVPEPSTIALFLSTVGGLALRRFVLSRRQRDQPDRNGRRESLALRRVDRTDRSPLSTGIPRSNRSYQSPRRASVEGFLSIRGRQLAQLCLNLRYRLISALVDVS